MHLWRRNPLRTDSRLRSRKKSYQERPLRLYKSPTLDRHGTPDSESKLPEDVEASDLNHGAGHQHRPHHPSSAPPLFQRHPEATPGELFYDLFFIANLSTFTGNHEVTKAKGLSNYIGFFCIIWFTWFQVALFDVRFSRDSVFDRMCKLAQFGVQVGFSFIAAKFNPAEADQTQIPDGQALSLLLMASRLVLMVQYISLWISLKRYAESRAVGWMVGTCLVTAAIFLGISFKFGPTATETSTGSAFIAWYLVPVVEAFAHIAIASKKRYFGFKGTHLVERMSLMTLIVLGEGVIALASAITKAWSTTTYFPGLGAAVMSVILLIYAIYMLYFDTLAQEHFGTIRQQFWAVLHFPLHMALVLFDEGTKQFVVFNVANKKAEDFSTFFLPIPIAQKLIAQTEPFEFTGAQNSTEYFSSQADAMLGAFSNFTNLSSVKIDPSNFDKSKLLEYADTVRNGVSVDAPEVFQAVSEFLNTVLEGVLKSLAIEGPENGTHNLFTSITSLFSLVFVYFYVSMGVALLTMLALWVISKRSKSDWFDFLRFAAWAAVGLTFCLLALLDRTSNGIDGAADTFMGSNWLLPTPMIILIALSVLFHLPFGHNA